MPQPNVLIIPELSLINSPSEDIQEGLPNAPFEISSSPNDTQELPIQFELVPISNDDTLIVNLSPTTKRIVTSGLTTSTENQSTIALTLAERRKIHNRTATLRQRRRLYAHKITCHDVDSRFAIRKIKQMLDDNYIPFIAVNVVKSQTSGKSTLYIGVDDESFARRNAAFVQTLFDTRNYNRIYKHNYNYPTKYRHR